MTSTLNIVRNTRQMNRPIKEITSNNSGHWKKRKHGLLNSPTHWKDTSSTYKPDMIFHRLMNYCSLEMLQFMSLVIELVHQQKQDENHLSQKLAISSRGYFVVSRLVNLEAKYSWNIALCGFLWLEMPICHQEEVRECSSKISSINIFGKVKANP